MSTDTKSLGSETIVGSIENQTDPSQRIDIKYVQNENAFVTSGIYTHFAEKEISIPDHLVVMDFQLMGAIVSEILEKAFPGPGWGNYICVCPPASGPG